jgi:hypothetical protein
MDGNQKIQVRNFLRTNLETLKGDDLQAFVERYDVREAGHVEMMMLDMGGMSDDFVSVAHHEKPRTHWVISADMAEKILYLDELVKENP